MVRDKRPLVVLVVTLVCAAMLAVLRRRRPRRPSRDVLRAGAGRLAGRDGLPANRSSRRARSSTSATGSKVPLRSSSARPAAPVVEAGQDEADASAHFDNRGRSSQVVGSAVPSTRAGFASSSPWPARVLAFLGAVAVATAAAERALSAVTAPRDSGQSLVALGPAERDLASTRAAATRRSTPATSRRSSPRGASASAVRASFGSPGVDAARRRRDGLRPGSAQQRVRARSRHGRVALGAPATGAGTTGRTGSRSTTGASSARRTRRVRARRARRAESSGAGT